MEEVKHEIESGDGAAATNIVMPKESYKRVQNKEPALRTGLNPTNKLI
jgi:hypothetical protein